MRRTGIFVTAVLGLLALAASAQQGKPNFTGKWQLNPEKSQIHPGKAAAFSIGIEQKDANIHIVRTVKDANGKESVTEFTCTTDGKDCAAKGAKVSLWYDGASLIEMDVSDSVVAKTSMTLGDGAKTLSLTITYIAPQADADTLVLEKIGI